MRKALKSEEFEAFVTLCRAAVMLAGANPGEDDFEDAMQWIIEVEDGRQTPESVLEKLAITHPAA